jgi:hypothetical protein
MGDALARVDKKERALQAELRRYKREVLRELLELLTPSQLAMFEKIYCCNDHNDVSMPKILEAIGMCERTIKKNKDKILDVLAERHV